MENVIVSYKGAVYLMAMCHDTCRQKKFNSPFVTVETGD
jgi:hypothetical protein